LERFNVSALKRLEMPELPEVETIARALRPQLVGRVVLEADLRWGRTLAFPSRRKFAEQIQGQTITAVGRRAKFLNLELLSPEAGHYNLLIHLRMSGDLSLKKGKIQPEKHDRLILMLRQAGGRGNQVSHLVFNDPRKFGRIWLTGDPVPVIGDLGPEPLSDEFTADWLYSNLRQRRRRLKPLLLDQTFLAGLGNIYTDEALHRARLHPLRLSNTVTACQAGRLWEAIRSVLKEGIRRNGASIDWAYRGGEFQNYFRVYDRAGEPCPVCGAAIERLVVGQRGTHICPRCQKV
jgi:formamidopyrimidine-DNA glycosylase